MSILEVFLSVLRRAVCHRKVREDIVIFGDNISGLSPYHNGLSYQSQNTLLLNDALYTRHFASCLCIVQNVNVLSCNSNYFGYTNRDNAIAVLHNGCYQADSLLPAR